MFRKLGQLLFRSGRAERRNPVVKYRAASVWAWAVNRIKLHGSDVARELTKGRRPTRQLREILYFLNVLFLLFRDPRVKAFWGISILDTTREVQSNLPQGFDISFPGLERNPPEFYALLRYPVSPDGTRELLKVDFDNVVEIREIEKIEIESEIEEY